MKNEIAVSEYDMIGAELYYCYNYFENVNKINKQLNKINNKMQDNSTKGKEYSIKNIKENSNIDWSKYQEIQNGCRKYCKMKIEKHNNEINSIHSKKGDISFTISCGIVFAIIGIFLVFLGYGLFGFNIVSYGIGQIILAIGLVIGIRSIFIFRSDSVKNRSKILQSLTEEECKAIANLNYYKNGTTINLKDSTILKEYLEQLSNTKAFTIFRKNEQKLVSDLEEEKANTRQYLLSKINENKIALNSLRDEFENNMNSRSTIIPSVYHNEEDIKNLIDYYVRRRGDTWKELVNEYERDKKLNQIISSIDNLSNQVNILTNGVVQCFNIIGQQLGIINQSVNSLQVATSINLDRISEIENQQERRLCELTSSIQNMNKQTKVIIESK